MIDEREAHERLVAYLENEQAQWIAERNKWIAEHPVPPQQNSFARRLVRVLRPSRRPRLLALFIGPSKGRLGDIRCISPPKLVVLQEFTRETPYGWVFRVDSEKHVRSGSSKDLLIGNGPIVVMKDSGDVIPLGSDADGEVVLRRFERSLGEHSSRLSG